MFQGKVQFVVDGIGEDNQSSKKEQQRGHHSLGFSFSFLKNFRVIFFVFFFRFFITKNKKKKSWRLEVALLLLFDSAEEVYKL